MHHYTALHKIKILTNGAELEAKLIVIAMLKMAKLY